MITLTDESTLRIEFTMADGKVIATNCETVEQYQEILKNLQDA